MNRNFLNRFAFALLLLGKGILSLAPPSSRGNSIFSVDSDTPVLNRRTWCATTASFFTFSSVANAAAEAPVYDRCLQGCIKECTKLAPGEVNRAYCTSSCEEYCRQAEVDGNPSGTNDVVRKDLS
mmetsp:Transcript_21251/g.32689  ORF Transcript_21251/g.32689 Transcript_21251/m.32689 type:complete len:125 (+) Transcript_21251:86-460(+)